MKASGKIGYGQSVEVRPGVFDEIITEIPFIGDVVQRTERFEQGDSVIPRYRTTTNLSVLSGGVQKLNYANIRYVTFRGNTWTVTSVVDDFPAVNIYIGEIYNGPLPA